MRNLILAALFFATLGCMTTPSRPMAIEFANQVQATPCRCVSESGTTIPGELQIVDSGFGVWTLASSQVMAGGKPAGSTPNAVLLLYFNGHIYYQNASGLFFQWYGAAWHSTKDPRPPTPPSPDKTLVTTQGPSIRDAQGNVWIIVSSNSGQLTRNNVLQAVTNHVTQMAYVNGVFWQYGSGAWYYPLSVNANGQVVWSAGQKNSPLVPVTSGGQMQIGVFAGDPGNLNGGTGDEISALIKATGFHPTAYDTYTDPTQTDQYGSANYSAGGIQSNPATTGMIPVVGIPMVIANQGFDRFADGSMDATINSIYKAYAEHGNKKIYIRPGWEMNGTWYTWSVYSSNVSGYVQAFQRIATLGHNYPGLEVRVIWNPGDCAGSVNFADFYPGDNYVDVIGTDVYGVDAGGVASSSPLDISSDPKYYSLFQSMAFAIAHNKTFAFGELGGGLGDTAFPANIQQAVTSTNVRVELMVLWVDRYGGNNDLRWPLNQNTANVWKAMVEAIQAHNSPVNVQKTSLKRKVRKLH